MLTTLRTSHSCMGYCLLHSPHMVIGYCASQLGHLPRVSNVSNAWLHLPHLHSAPSGGATLQLGQANPARRGIFSRFSSTRACCRPPSN